MTMPRAKICKGCWQQMRVPVPLYGVLSAPFRLFGIRPSRMNPNTCTICELMFTKVMRARKITINATVMFADLRDYTAFSQSLPPDAISGLLDTFYDECASAIWEYDGLLNKTLGDSIMAVFNFPIQQSDHAKQAIQRCWHANRDGLGKAFGFSGSAFGVGIGYRHRRAQLWRIWPIAPGPDRDRHGREHSVSCAICR
jgi:hypothetical protein